MIPPPKFSGRSLCPKLIESREPRVLRLLHSILTHTNRTIYSYKMAIGKAVRCQKFEGAQSAPLLVDRC